VEAADLVPVSELRVYVNGVLADARPIARGESATIPLVFAGDAFVTVEVEGDAVGDTADRYRAVAPRMVPFAFTNPIFVDVDGDGWQAPGLGSPPPAALVDPLGS